MKKVDLDARERLGLMLGVVALIFVVFLAVYIPLGPKKQYDQTREEVQSLRNQIDLALLDQIDIEERLRNEEALKKQLESRSRNFALFSFMDRLLREHDLQGRTQVENTRSSRTSRNRNDNEVMVDLKMQRVSLDEVVAFLHTVYASENLVRMYQMEIRPMPRDEGLYCEMTFMTVRV